MTTKAKVIMVKCGCITNTSQQNWTLIKKKPSCHPRPLEWGEVALASRALLPLRELSHSLPETQDLHLPSARPQRGR